MTHSKQIHYDQLVESAFVHNVNVNRKMLPNMQNNVVIYNMLCYVKVYEEEFHLQSNIKCINFT